MAACARPARFAPALVAVAVVWFAASGTTRAQDLSGAQVFERSCASCHTGAAESRAPAPAVMRTRAPQAILESLVTGAMRVQGSRLSGSERRAVAEFLTGKAIDGDVSGSEQGRCSATDALSASRPTPVAARAAPGDGRAASDLPASEHASAQVMWRGWSPTLANTRFQPPEHADLAAADVPRLTLKWAFGFPDASVAWSQPTVARGRVFVGSQNGTVYALDAKSGCIHWTFSAAGGVRTAVAVGPADEGRSTSVYFGDTSATAYSLDAETGRLLWTRTVDDHPLARITGSPTLHEGRLYVPVSSYEEAQGADPQYGCCTFRGSIVALDASSGIVVWKTYMITEQLRKRGTSTAGVPLWGPSGSAIWSAPSVDAARGALYVATGNSYSAPPQSSSNAVVALDLRSGAVRWMRQVTPNDIYVTGCRAGSGNPNCPDANGPDHDFGSPPMLTRANGRDLIVIGQKSGVGYAMDPDRRGELVWQYRAGQGGALGGMEWGAAADGDHAYFAVSDITHPKPGGLHAVRLASGEQAWFAPPPPAACGTGRGCNGAQSAAVTVIGGAVFSGSNDGALRAYSTSNGSIVWEFDTNREFQTVNGVPARGGSMQGPGPAVAGGMIYVNSGYGAFGGRPGNVLLAFGVE